VRVSHLVIGLTNGPSIAQPGLLKGAPSWARETDVGINGLIKSVEIAECVSVNMTNVSVDYDSQGKPIGYFSVRRKPSRKRIEAITGVYQEMMRSG
jgi:hypothetical protein